MTIVDTMEAYDPFYSKTWTRMPSMPLALAGHCMLQYRDSLVVVGGTSTAERESDRILSFNITTQLWSDLGNLSQPRVGHGCSLIERSAQHTWRENFSHLLISGRMLWTSS